MSFDAVSFCQSAPKAKSAPVAVRAHLGSPNPGSKDMKKPRKDPVREDRIHKEGIVEANGEEEQVLG